MIQLECVQIGERRWVFRRKQDLLPPARSDLPCPGIISDEMPPTEQVDGKFYTSKSQFRAVGRSLGLIEVGNEKLPPRKRIKSDAKSISDAVDKAVARVKRGERVRKT